MYRVASSPFSEWVAGLVIVIDHINTKSLKFMIYIYVNICIHTLELVHDSLKCMTFMSAWQSWLNNTLTLWLPFAHDAMIDADFDIHVPDPFLDFQFRHPHLDFRFTIICVAIAILSWPSLRLSLLQPSLRLSLSWKLSLHNNLHILHWPSLRLSISAPSLRLSLSWKH